MSERNRTYLREDIERWSVPVSVSGCWLWEGRAEYARMQFIDKRTYVNRLAHVAFEGQQSTRDTARHKCHNDCCVNSSHLSLVRH